MACGILGTETDLQMARTNIGTRQCRTEDRRPHFQQRRREKASLLAFCRRTKHFTLGNESNKERAMQISQLNGNPLVMGGGDIT